MACLNTLKQEIKTLESVFPKNHERFQIVSASVDELNCRFIGKNGKKYEIHANITVSDWNCILSLKITCSYCELRSDGHVRWLSTNKGLATLVSFFCIWVTGICVTKYVTLKESSILFKEYAFAFFVGDSHAPLWKCLCSQSLVMMAVPFIVSSWFPNLSGKCTFICVVYNNGSDQSMLLVVVSSTIFVSREQTIFFWRCFV